MNRKRSLDGLDISTTAEPLLPMVQKLYQTHYPSSKPKKKDLIYTAILEDELVGVVRIRTITPWRLLTGLLVSPTHRNRGIGHQLVTQCCLDVQAEELFCFAYSDLSDFYRRHGFQVVESGQLPASLSRLFERYTRGGKSLIPMRIITDVCR